MALPGVKRTEAIRRAARRPCTIIEGPGMPNWQRAGGGGGGARLIGGRTAVFAGESSQKRSCAGHMTCPLSFAEGPPRAAGGEA